MNNLTLVLFIVAIVVFAAIILINKGVIHGIKPKITPPFADEYSKSVLINYNEYEMSKAEKIRYFFMAFIVLFALGFLFYRNIIIALIFSAVAIKYPKMKKVAIIKKRKDKLQLEFKDALYSIYTSISAGASANNAIIESLEDLKRLYIEGDAYIIKEFEIMVNRIKMQQPVEVVLENFAKRSGLEDIENFTEVFKTSMNTGGRQTEIIKNTVNTIVEKIEIKREISVMISEKKFEAKIMNVMPIFIILFLSVTAADYLAPMFTEVLGRIIMTIVLILLGVSFIVSNKIMDIEV